MTNAFTHKVITALEKRGNDTWSAISKATKYTDEVLRLYPGLHRSPAKVADKIMIAASI